MGGALGMLRVVATACSSSHHPATAPEPPIREPWRSPSITPIGQPVAEGDIAHGSTRRPAKDELFWCGKNELFHYREPRHHPDGATSDAWRGGTLLQACEESGSASSGTPRHLPRSLGATVGNRSVVAEAGVLVAFDRGPA